QDKMGQQTTAPAPLPQVSNPNSPNRGFNLAKIKQELPDRDDGIGSMSQTEASIWIKVEPPDESEQGRTVDHSAQHRAFMLKSIKEEPLDEQSTQAMPVLGGIGHGSGGDGVSALTVRLTDMTRSAPPPNCALDMFDEQQIPHIAHSFPTGPSRGERYLPNNSGIGGLKTVPHFDGSLPSSFDQEKLRRLEEEDRLKDEYQRKMKKNEELERRKHIEEKKRKEGRARDIMRDRLRESEEREERRKNLTDEERNKEDEKRRKEEDKNRKKKEEERERRRKEREEMERRKKVEEEERRKEEEERKRREREEIEKKKKIEEERKSKEREELEKRKKLEEEDRLRKEREEKERKKIEEEDRIRKEKERRKKYEDEKKKKVDEEEKKRREKEEEEKAIRQSERKANERLEDDATSQTSDFSSNHPSEGNGDISARKLAQQRRRSREMKEKEEMKARSKSEEGEIDKDKKGKRKESAAEIREKEAARLYKEQMERKVKHNDDKILREALNAAQEAEEKERRKLAGEKRRRKEEERKLRAQNSEESGDVSSTKSAVKKKKTAERTVSADSSDMPQRKRGKNHDQSESSRKLAEPVKKKKKMISDSSEDEGTVDETTSSAVPLLPPAPITERNSSSTSSLPPSSSKNSLPPPPSKTFGQKDKTANHSSGMQLGWNGSAASVGRIPKKAKNSADSQISPPSRTSMLSRPTVLPSSSTHSIAPSMKHPETFTPTSVQKKNSCERQRVGASHAGGNQGGTIDAANRRGSDMATEKRPSRVKQPRSKLKDMTGLDTPMDAITRDMNKGHAKSSTTPLAAHPVEKRVKFDSVGGPSTSFQSYASGGVQYADGRSNAYGADRSPCGRSPSDRSSSSFGSPSASPLTEGGMSPPLHPPPSRAVPPPPSSSTSCLQTVTPASSRARPAPSEEDLMCFSSDRPRPPIPTRARVGSHRGDHYLLTDDSSDGSSRSCSYTSNAAPAAPAAAPPPEIPSAPIHIPHSPTINRPEEPEIHAGSTAEKPAMGQPDEPSRPAAVAAAATPAATLNHVAATVATSVPAAAATEAATTTFLAATPAVTVNPAAATAIPKPSAAVATTSRPHAASWMPDLKTIHAAAAAPQQATAARSDPRFSDPRRRPTGAVPTVAPTAAANIQPQKQPRPVPPPAAADAAIPPPVVVPTQAVVAPQRVAPPPVIAPPPDAAVAWVPIRGDPRGGAALPPGWDKTLTELLQWEEKNRRTIRGYAFTVAVDEDSLGLKPIQRLAAFKRATTHVDSMEKRNGNGERDDKLCRSFRCLNHGFNAEYNDLRPKHWMIPLVRARSLSPPPLIPTPPTMRRQPPPAPVQPPVQENHDTPLFTLRPTARRDDDEGPSTYTSNLPPGMDDGIMPIRPPPRQRVKEKEPLWRLKERQEMQRKIAVEMAEKEAENREKARRIIQKRTIVEEFSEKTVIDLEEWKRRENERNAFGDHERDRREYERRDHEGETGDQRRSMDEEAERRARRDQVEEERRQRQARTAKKTEIAQGFQQQLPVSTAAPRHSAGMNPLGWTASNGVSFPSSASSSSTPIPPALSNVDNPVRPTSRSSNEENTLPSSSSTPSESLKNVVMEYARRRAQEMAMEIKPASTSSAHPPLQLPQQSQSYQPPPYQSVPPPLAPSVPDAPRPPHLPCFVYDPSGNMVPYPLDLPYDRPPPDPSTMHLQGYPINPTPDTIPLPATRREEGEGENGEEPMEVEEQGNDPEPATNGMENGRREEEDRPGPSNVTPVLVQLGDEESDEEDDEIPPPNMQLFGSHIKRRADWQPTTYNEDARTVIVSGNIKDTNEEDLRQLFSRFGRIDVIETYCMFKNVATARFIRYKKLKSANAAVTGEILELNNRKISVNHYLKRPKPD
ncbi:hypothetical protein PRIPAC_70982, partial [Pristionchus pacificus]